MVRFSWVAILFCLAFLSLTGHAWAWKPYTHVKLADLAKDEAVANNGILVRGKVYALRPEVIDALKAYPEFFDGGVVGPDGMPDVTFGQAVIHPVKSGQWLRRLLQVAYQRRQAGSVTGEAAKQEMAFTYGFISHGAGDMWGHTLVNNFAQGVFPSFGDIFGGLIGATPANQAFGGFENALRHMVVEQYVGDATHGFDGNPDFTPVPKTCTGSNCDFSDSSTDGITLSAPNDLLYSAFIDPNAPLPVNSRGPAINFFTGLKQKVDSAAGSFDPGQDIRDFVRKTKNHALDIKNNADHALQVCSDISFDLGFIPDPGDVIDCLAAVGKAGLNIGIDAILEGVDVITSTAKTAFDASIGQLVAAYFRAWSNDITDGLKHWTEFGLCFSQGAFDAQTQRNIQNGECATPPIGQTRQQCETALGLFSYVRINCEPFLFEHLLSMLGLPDWFGEMLEVLDQVKEKISGIVNTLGIPFTPIIQGVQYIESLKDRFIDYLVEQAFGVDLVGLDMLFKSPEALLDLEDIPPNTLLELFGLHTSSPVSFFRHGDHALLDGFMGLTGPHLVTIPPPVPDFPVPALRLTDDAEFNANVFAAAADTVMQTRLLLLDGATLNRLFDDVLKQDGVLKANAAVTVNSYADHTGNLPANVMVDDNTQADASSWFGLMDGDHAWRVDGQPVFPVNRTDPKGGNGTYPLWESCVLRPAFRALFKNWEPAGGQFDDLGDAVSSDPTDTVAPDPGFAIMGPKVTVGGTTFVGGSTSFTLAAADAVFASGQLKTRARIYPTGTTAPSFTSGTATLTLGVPANAAEGSWQIDFGASDPCHGFDDLPGKASAGSQTVVLDKRAPVITITSPSDTIYGTADHPTVTATAVDPAPNASGLSTLTAALDNVNPIAIGSQLNLFNLAPGPHSITFTATDNVGNISSSVRNFRILATSQSLLQNLDAARAAGKIPNTNTYNNFRQQLVQAVARHNAGDLQGERGILNGLIKAFIAARNGSTGQECPTGAASCLQIDPPTANLFIAALAELIPNIGRTSLISDGQTLGVLEALVQEFLAGNVASRASFDELRELVTHALDLHYADQHSAEWDALRSFNQDTQTLVSRNQSNCSSHELPCFALDSAAAGRLRTAATDVINSRR